MSHFVIDLLLLAASIDCESRNDGKLKSIIEEDGQGIKLNSNISEMRRSTRTLAIVTDFSFLCLMRVYNVTATSWRV